MIFGEGVGEGDLLRAVRVWGDSARRVAQFQAHYFHHTIEEPFRGQGMRDNEAYEAAIMSALRMGHSAEQMMGWLLRRHGEAFLTEHQFLHVETALEEAGIRQRPPRGSEAAAFADLSGYTRLTEEAGDDVAAQVSLTLAELVNEVAEEHRGEVVKMLGDGSTSTSGIPGRGARLARDRGHRRAEGAAPGARRGQRRADDLRRRRLLRPDGQHRRAHRGTGGAGSSSSGKTFWIASSGWVPGGRGLVQLKGIRGATHADQVGDDS